MRVSQTDPPEVVFALPGDWVRADLDDERQVAELAGLLDGVTDDPVSWIASAKGLGGVLLMFRVRSDTAVSLLFAWPPGEQGGDASLEGLRGRFGAEGDLVEHVADYACVRVRSEVGPDATEVLTYGLVHPESGRLLVVRFTAFGGSFSDLDLGDYDTTVSHLWWEEGDG